MTAGMVLYHCMIEIKNDARALAFASAVENWPGSLQAQSLIRLYRPYQDPTQRERIALI